jgi:hypothetical protein
MMMMMMMMTNNGTLATHSTASHLTKLPGLSHIYQYSKTFAKSSLLISAQELATPDTKLQCILQHVQPLRHMRKAGSLSTGVFFFINSEE